MTRAPLFRPQAEAEALEARRWYDARRAGLGEEFGAEVDAAVARIVANMLRRCLSIVVAAGLLLTTGIYATQRSQVGARATPSVSLDEERSAAVSRGDVPGLVVMAATRDRILYQGVFGKAEVDHERPMTADALFRIASMTKAVTSVAAMQLYQQGRFALDDPAETFLPELAHLMVFESFDNATGAYQVRPAAKKVTIRHLFTHTSGLGYGFTSPIVRDFKPRDGEQYEAGPLLFEPGTQWIYGTSVDFGDGPPASGWPGRCAAHRAAQSAAASLDDFQRRWWTLIDGERLHPL